MKVFFLIGAVALQAMAPSANAQSSGEADPAQAKAPPVAAMSSAERADARALRFEAGLAAARRQAVCGDCDSPQWTAAASRNERLAAAAQRYASVSALNRAGLLPVTTLYYPDPVPGP